MLDIEYAPEQGMIYATYIDRLVLQPYQNKGELAPYLKEENLLELHLFDKEKELRFLKTRNGGIKRYEIPGNETYDDTYVESSYLLGKNIDRQENLTQKIEVVNYIRYDENDLLHIVNYRLKEV